MSARADRRLQTLRPSSVSQSYLATTTVLETVFAYCRLDPSSSPSSSSSSPPSPTCPSSTEIVLPHASLTGITINPPSSPSSCYSLPTPTSALEAAGFLSADAASFDPSTQTDPIFFYLGDDATCPQYMATVINASRYLLDLSGAASAAGQVALSVPGGGSIVFDGQGIHVFDPLCRSATSLTVDNFFEQMVSIADTPAPSPPCQARHVRRDDLLQGRDASQSDFTVLLQINKTMTGSLATDDLDVTFGASPCTSASTSTNNDSRIQVFTCQYPGAESAQTACQARFNDWLGSGPATGRSSNRPSSAGEIFTYLGPLLNKTGPTLANLIPSLGAKLATGLDWLGNTARQAIDEAVDVGGSAICEAVHALDQNPLVLSDPGGSTTSTIAVFGSPLAPTITQVLGLAERGYTAPPRLVDPKITNFPLVTMFNNLFSNMGGLFGHDVMSATAGVAFARPLQTGMAE